MGCNRWRWLPDGLLPLCTAVLRATALWPWLELLRRWLAPSQGDALLPLPLAIGLVLAGMVSARRALAGRQGLLVSRVAVASGGLVAMAAVLWWRFYRAEFPLWELHWAAELGRWLVHWQNELPPPFLVTLATAYLWLRGLLDGQRPLHSDDAWGTFAAGFVALAVAAMAANLDGRGAPAGLARLVLLFFSVGLVALATSSLGLARPATRPQGPPFAPNRYWLGTVLLVVAGLVAMGLFLSALLAPETVAHALRWTSVIFHAAGRLLLLALLAASYLLFLVLEPLIRGLRGLLRTVAPERLQMPDWQRELEELARERARGPAGPGPDLRWLELAALIVALGLVFALALRRFWQAGEREVDESRETIFTAALLRDQLAALWRRWLGRRRRTAPPASAYLGLAGETGARRAIRAIYQALLAAARRQGRPRAPSETPTEFRQALERAWPGAGANLETITRAYLGARYGLEPPTSAQAQQASQAWDALLAWLERQDPADSA